MGIGTGHSATVSWQGTAVEYARSITGHEVTSPLVDATHLGTTGTRAYIPADLGELTTMQIEALFDTEAAPLALNDEQAVVVTFKQLPGETTAANLTGTGWFTRVKYPDHNTNEIMTLEYELTWKDAPTFNPATTV